MTKKLPVDEVGAGELTLDELLTKHPTSITRAELMVVVARQRANRAAWKAKKDKKESA